MSFSHLSNDLTEAQAELLTCLYEEAAEVIQVIAKIDRFGIGDHHPVSGESNTMRLHAEVGDFLAVVDRLIALGVLGEPQLDVAIAAKHLRLDRYLRKQEKNDSIENY